MRIFIIILWLSIVFSNTVHSQVCNTFLNQGHIRGVVSKDNYVWAATAGGLVRFDTLSGTKSYFTKDNSAIPQNGLLKIKKDQNGSLWMYSEGGLVIKYDGINFTSYDLKELFGIAYPDLFSIQDMEVAGTKIYVASRTKLFIYDNSWTSVAINYPQGDPGSFVTEIHAYNNSLYFSISVYLANSYNNHFVKYDGTSFSLIKSVPLNNPIDDTNIYGTFTVDDRGDIWASQYQGGIVHIDVITTQITVYTIPISVKICPNIYINIIIFYNDKLLFGDSGKGGFFSFDINTQVWKSINETNSTMNRSGIYDITIFPGGTTYIGTYTHLVKVNWAGSGASTLYSLDLHPERIALTDQVGGITCIDNELLVRKDVFGYDTLRGYDLESQTSKIYTEVGGYDVLPGTIIKDKNGKKWLGGLGGLYFFDESSGQWVKYTINQADTILYINRFDIDKYNNLWLATPYEIIKITPAGNIESLYTIPSNDYFGGFKASGERIWFTLVTNTGLNCIDILSGTVTQNFSNEPVWNILGDDEQTYFYGWRTIWKLENNAVVQYLQTDNNASIHSVCMDNNHDLWLVTSDKNSLFKYSVQDETYTEFNYTNSCLSYIKGVFKDDQNRIWVLGDGLYYMDYDFDENGITSVTEIGNEGKSDQNVLYPNPVQTHATVKFSGNERPESISIIGIASKELGLLNYTGDDLNVDLSFLKSGMYIMKVDYKDSNSQYIKFAKN